MTPTEFAQIVFIMDFTRERKRSLKVCEAEFERIEASKKIIYAIRLLCTQKVDLQIAQCALVRSKVSIVQASACSFIFHVIWPAHTMQWLLGKRTGMRAITRAL